MVEVERVDFVSVPTRDTAQARRFYGMPFVPSAGVALRVPDVEGAGVEFYGETDDTGVCHMSFSRDFDGNEVILHRRYAEPRPDGTGHRESREREDARKAKAGP